MLHRLHQQFRPQTGQPVMEGLHRLIRVNGGGPLGNDIPGVQRQSHVHDGHPGLLLSVQDGPVNGGRPPVLGQQGGVHIDAPQPGIGQNLLGQNPAVGRHHDEVGRQLDNGLQRRAVPEFGGLKDRQAVGLGTALHRRGLELHPPVLGFIRLTEHPHHLMSGGHQGLQRGHGKIRRAHE